MLFKQSFKSIHCPTVFNNFSVDDFIYVDTEKCQLFMTGMDTKEFTFMLAFHYKFRYYKSSVAKLPCDLHGIIWVGMFGRFNVFLHTFNTYMDQLTSCAQMARRRNKVRNLF